MPNMARHLGKGESQLHLGKARADADMHAGAERQMLPDRARDIEDVGIGKGRGVTVAAGVAMILLPQSKASASPILGKISAWSRCWL